MYNEGTTFEHEGATHTVLGFVTGAPENGDTMFTWRPHEDYPDLQSISIFKLHADDRIVWVHDSHMTILDCVARVFRQQGAY